MQKFIGILVGMLLATSVATADELPQSIMCYQDAANAEDIDAYMDCFTTDAEMVDVSRTFNGVDAIREWALKEVIPHGDTFKHRKILESQTGFAKTEVNWLSWVVHYSYWWDEDGKITKMSLQYAD